MKPMPFVIGSAVLAVATAVLVLGQLRQQAALNRLSDRLERLEAQHHRPGGASPAEGAFGLAPASLGRRAPLSAHIPGEERANESPAMRAREIATSKSTLDNSFSSEPINAAWAGKTIHTVEEAIVEVAADGAPMPEGAHVDCRSKTCRIQLNLADGAESDRFVMPLLTKFAKTLPVTQMLEVPSADGKRFDVYIYASAADL